jgi:hypothetical protein
MIIKVFRYPNNLEPAKQTEFKSNSNNKFKPGNKNRKEKMRGKGLPAGP